MELIVSFDEIKNICDPVSSEQISLLFCFGDCHTELHVNNSHECIIPTKHVTIIKIQS